MEENALQDEPPPARLVAGALAHLARHMTTGCPRAAELAALLLERVVADADADPHLRAHARELVDILERDQATDARRLPLMDARPTSRAAH
ncbi:MAG: hypothetical protein C3F19_16120 [Rhodocyclales bacterium]|jgi:hypothetical protein|nr:MAG: hypothetical protein C3F19_16120 [Rhodocyclales bacterium]